MTLTFQIDDEALSALKDALRIKKEHLHHLISASPGDNEVLAYAQRILLARRALGLSNSGDQCCSDMTSIQPVEP